MAALSNAGPHENRAELVKYVIAIRGACIDKAAEDEEIDAAYIITCKLTYKLLEQLGDLDVQYVLIDKTKEEILDQLENDDTREDKEHWEELIDDWFDWYESQAANQRKEECSLKKRYYSLATEGAEADIYIYGDIVSWPWLESDVSSYNLAQEVAALEDVDNINVYINSYGGEVAEGLAIYNALRRHKAKVKTVCDGFACSAASVVFMAGDERVMSNASLLMIHNAWLATAGNADELRKDADDLDTITQASINAYLDHITIDEAELKALMDAESWISPDDALEMGFATSVTSAALQKAASQSLRKQLAEMILANANLQDPPEPTPTPEPEPEPEPPENKPIKFVAKLFAERRD